MIRHKQFRGTQFFIENILKLTYHSLLLKLYLEVTLLATWIWLGRFDFLTAFWLVIHGLKKFRSFGCKNGPYNFMSFYSSKSFSIVETKSYDAPNRMTRLSPHTLHPWLLSIMDPVVQKSEIKWDLNPTPNLGNVPEFVIQESLQRYFTHFCLS